MKVSQSLLSLLVMMMVGAAAMPAAGQTAVPPSIRGQWKLDPERSDRPNANRPVETADQRRGRSASDPLGAAGYGGFPETEADPTAVMALMRPPLALTISGTDSSLIIAPERALKQRIIPGRPDVTDTLLDGTVRITKARWKKDALVVERKFEGLARIKETYSLDPGPDGLVVNVEVSPVRFSQKIVMRRVYQRSAEAPKKP